MKWYWWALILLVVATVGIVIYKVNKDKKAKEQKLNNTTLGELNDTLIQNETGFDPATATEYTSSNVRA